MFRQSNSIKFLTIGAAMASVVGITSTAIAAEKWDLPAAYSAKNHVSSSYIQFAETVNKNSNGELEIIVHASGSLYKGSEIFRAVRTGQVPIGGRYMGAHASEDSIFGLDTVPFIATDFDQAMKLYVASKPALEKALEDRGLKLLFTAPWPPQGLFSKKAINSTSDMKGMKFRAYDANTSRLAELMGAIPTKTEATEISQAFSTGVADSMVGSGAIGVFQKLWDYVDNFYTVNAWIPKSAVIVNMDAWNDLNDATKKVVLDAASDAEKDVWEKVKGVTENYNKTLAENGMNVSEPSKALQDELLKIGKTMSSEWTEEASPEGKNAMNLYLQN